MTKIENGKILIEHEPEDKCEYCGKVAELRPYGKNGAKICYECGEANEPETTNNFIAMLEKNNVNNVTINFDSLTDKEDNDNSN